MYSKGDVASVVYFPFDNLCFGFVNGDGSSGAYHQNSNTHLGIMVNGTANTAYSLQYAYTIEYASASVSTDLVPVSTAPHGDAKAAVFALAGLNPANPPSVRQTPTGYVAEGALLGAQIGSFFGAAGAAAGSAAGAAAGYFQAQSTLRAGQTISV